MSNQGRHAGPRSEGIAGLLAELRPSVLLGCDETSCAVAQGRDEGLSWGSSAFATAGPSAANSPDNCFGTGITSDCEGGNDTDIGGTPPATIGGGNNGDFDGNSGGWAQYQTALPAPAPAPGASITQP